MKKFNIFLLLMVLSLAIFGTVGASENPDTGTSHNIVPTLILIVFLLVIANVSSLVEKFGQPAVLGELAIGVVIGNLDLLGIGIFEPIK